MRTSTEMSLKDRLGVWKANESALNLNGATLQDMRDVIEAVCVGPHRSYGDGSC